MKAELALVSMPHMKGLTRKHPGRFNRECFRLDAARCAFWVAVDADFLGELRKKHGEKPASEILTLEAKG